MYCIKYLSQGSQRTMIFLAPMMVFTYNFILVKFLSKWIFIYSPQFFPVNKDYSVVCRTQYQKWVTTLMGWDYFCNFEYTRKYTRDNNGIY